MTLLAVIAPISNFIGMIWGMTHQIMIVYSIHGRNLSEREIKEKLEILCMPRIIYGIICGILSMLYGLELHNYWMFATILIAVILSSILAFLIWRVTKRFKPSH